MSHDSGPVPPTLYSEHRHQFSHKERVDAYLKLRAADLGVRKIDAGATSGYFIFEESNKVDPKRVLKLIQGKPKEYRLDGPLKLRFTHDARTDEKLFARIEQLVDQLT